MRLGGPVFEEWNSPQEWIALLKAEGYSAGFSPCSTDADDDTIKAYADAAAEADIVIAEVGAFGVNPIHPDKSVAEDAIKFCAERLKLADKIGARCCTNIAGSRNPDKWDGAHEANFDQETIDLTVASVQQIIDRAEPQRTAYGLEMMPYVPPSSADEYLEITKSIDRGEKFAVHFDPVNIINSPYRYCDTTSVIKDCFDKLGPYIKSCHGKDILLEQRLTVHLEEVRPGEGNLDYETFLRELDKLDPDTPLMLEHLPSAEEYRLAAAHVRSVAEKCCLSFK